jgi:hypothetical protein
MYLLNIVLGLLHREMDCAFDAIKLETYHIFGGFEIPVALGRFLLGNGLLSVHMPCDGGGREQGVDSMD